MTVDTLSPSDLADLRSVQAGFMPETFQVLRRTSAARDAFNDRTDTWQVAATVAGRIASTNARGSGNEVVTNAMLLTGTPSFDVTLPFDTVVEDGDRLKLVRTGDEFEVKPGSYPATSLTALRITVQRIGAP